jgi:hypothetical protein
LAEEEEPGHRLFHGTSIQSALYFLNGGGLDLVPANDEHREGNAGFYLCTDPGDAEFFAIVRAPGSILELTLSNRAWRDLGRHVVTRPIPINAAGIPLFAGNEVYVPVAAFPLFNRLLAQGEIHVRPYHPDR